MGWKHYSVLVVYFIFLSGFGSCGSTAEESSVSESSCAPSQLSSGLGDSGFASVFTPDPITSSGDLTLTPKSRNLDQYRTQVKLSNLTGQGVLKGKYVEILNGLSCDNQYGAFETNNKFSYSHQDSRFQESMVYYFGDTYLQSIDNAGYLHSNRPTRLIAHCEMDDNAFFMRKVSPLGDSEEIVCLGDSVSTAGAFYSDDAVVTLHELQHGTTGGNYSMTEDMNQFWFDEAGALNESVSDFMSMMFTDGYVSPSSPIDIRVFSRWALGTFDPKANHTRGAHKCPMYDSQFPECGSYPKFEAPGPDNGFTSNISYIYPDGVGWPYPNNTKSQTPVQEYYENFSSQEEIHNSGMVILGGLWDAYTALKNLRPNDASSVKKGMTQLVMESIRHLPAPNSTTNHSPITFIGFVSNIIKTMESMPEYSASERSAVAQAFKARGLFEYTPIDSPTWMGVGPGTNKKIASSASPGFFVLDDPMILQRWLLNMGGKPSLVKQPPTSTNSKLDPGDVVAIWFDIENTADISAGGVLVTATSTDPDVKFLDAATNIGFMSLAGKNQVQTMYGKINGKTIVSAIGNLSGGRSGIPISNTYFTSNPFFNKSWRTAVWVKVSSEAPHGKVVTLNVQASPSNGVTSSKDFSITIN